MADDIANINDDQGDAEPIEPSPEGEPKQDPKQKPKEQIYTLTKKALDERLKRAEGAGRKKLIEEFGIEDPESLAESLNRLAEFETQAAERAAEEERKKQDQAKAAGKFEELESGYRKTISEKDGMITKLQQEKDELDKGWQQRHHSHIVNEALTQAYLEHGGYEKAVGDAVLAMRNAGYGFKVSDGNKITVLDSDGSQARDDNMAELSMGGWVQKFLREHAYFSKDRLAQGTNASSNMASLDEMTLQEKIAEAEKMKAEGKSGKEIAKKLGWDK